MDIFNGAYFSTNKMEFSRNFSGGGDQYFVVKTPLLKDGEELEVAFATKVSSNFYRFLQRLEEDDSLVLQVRDSNAFIIVSNYGTSKLDGKSVVVSRSDAERYCRKVGASTNPLNESTFSAGLPGLNEIVLEEEEEEEEEVVDHEELEAFDAPDPFETDGARDPEDYDVDPNDFYYEDDDDDDDDDIIEAEFTEYTPVPVQAAELLSDVMFQHATAKHGGSYKAQCDLGELVCEDGLCVFLPYQNQHLLSARKKRLSAINLDYLTKVLNLVK